MPFPSDASDSPAGVKRNRAAAESLSRYWRSNVKVLIVLLLAWAAVGLGCGVLFADWLNHYSLGGYKLGFWFAQQGSIIGFVLIILLYCVTMNRLDAKHHRELEELGAVKPSEESDSAGGAS